MKASLCRVDIIELYKLSRFFFTQNWGVQSLKIWAGAKEPEACGLDPNLMLNI